MVPGGRVAVGSPPEPSRRMYERPLGELPFLGVAGPRPDLSRGRALLHRDKRRLRQPKGPIPARFGLIIAAASTVPLVPAQRYGSFSAHPFFTPDVSTFALRVNDKYSDTGTVILGGYIDGPSPSKVGTAAAKLWIPVNSVSA